MNLLVTQLFQSIGMLCARQPKGKVYAVRRHSRSLCLKRQPGMCATYTSFAIYIETPDLVLQGRGLSVVATITAVMNLLSTQLSQNLGYKVAAANTQSTVAPNFYVQPIRLLSFNLAPVNTSGQNLSTYLLCVLLWLGATFIVASMFPFGTRTEEAVVANILEKGVSAHKRKQVQLALHEHVVSNQPFSAFGCPGDIKYMFASVLAKANA